MIVLLKTMAAGVIPPSVSTTSRAVSEILDYGGLGIAVFFAIAFVVSIYFFIKHLEKSNEIRAAQNESNTKTQIEMMNKYSQALNQSTEVLTGLATLLNERLPKDNTAITLNTERLQILIKEINSLKSDNKANIDQLSERFRQLEEWIRNRKT